MKIIYESFDGLQFETEKECVEHEEMHHNIFGYDLNGAPITDYYCIETLLEESQYLKITSEKALEVMQKRCSCLTGNMTVGPIYAYSDEKNMFIPLERQIHKLYEEIKELENIKEVILSN